MRKLRQQMNFHRTYRFVVFGIAMLFAATASTALTLGRSRAAVFVGQPLNLTVPIQMEPDEGFSSLCFEADVFYGDARQDASQVTVTAKQSGSPQSADVLVSAFTPINEPVVTVYLRAGCSSKTTRRYVLLADIASELAQPVAVLAVPKPLRATMAPSEVQMASVGGGDAPGRSIPSVKPVFTKVIPRLATAVDSRLGARSSANRGSRLKLTLAEQIPEGDAALKLSTEILVGASEDLKVRAQATALWAALNATPQEILSADVRRQSLEEDLKVLRDVTAKNRLKVNELVIRLDKAERERYSNPLVFGLIAVFLACVLGMAYLWRRASQDGLKAAPWWRNDSSYGDSELTQAGQTIAPGPDEHELNLRPMPSTAMGTVSTVNVPQRAVEMLNEVDIDLQLERVPVADHLGASSNRNTEAVLVNSSKTVAQKSGHLDFAHSLASSMRSLNTQEMLDVRQQAEFFMTLGRHDEAIDMLKNSIDNSSESNPLIFLDLLKMLHTLGRKAEYENYRADFNEQFSGLVPVYSEFNQGGNGLEEYADVCDQIGALWPSEQVVAYIEKCLVHTPADEAGQPFDLEAYRDLLMLHGMATRIASSIDTGLLPFSAARSIPTQTEHSSSVYRANEVHASERTQPIAAPAVSPEKFSVDLDLSEPMVNLIDFDPAVLAKK